MSKSVLVIDTPESCEGCCMFCYTYHGFQCLITGKTIENSTDRPDWCPLMDLPEKDNGDYPANTFDAGFAEGWNQCIDEITGEVK